MKLHLNMIQDILTYNKDKSISYTEYRDLVADLVRNESTSGNEKTMNLVNYTMLNDRRMKRWDKTVRISEQALERLAKFNGNITWLVLTESWCGDAAHLIPVMNKLADLNKGIDLQLVFRDENDSLMNQFLTNGGRAIPKLIMIDNTSGEVLNTYGPRPSVATKFVNDFKAQHGKLTPEFKEDLQRWYNKDKGQTAVEDLLTLLGV